jgi:hypothetical protein
MLSVQQHTAKRFQIVVMKMPITGKSGKKWTRSEKLSLIAPSVAIIAALAAWGTFFVNSSNRKDAQAQTQLAQSERKIDGQIDRKLIPVGEQLLTKADGTTVTRQFGDLHDEITRQFQSLHSDIEKGNDLIRQSREEVAKLSGRVEGIDKNVDLLLQKQLKVAADFPPPVLADQIENVNFLYRLAVDRKVDIPNETNNLLRVKLASVHSQSPEFWPLASTVLSRASAALIGTMPTFRIFSGTIRGSSFENLHVILDGSSFMQNSFENCVVEYRGGPTIVQGNIFINCLFVFNVRGTPPPDGQRLVRTILASNLRSVTQS